MGVEFQIFRQQAYPSAGKLLDEIEVALTSLGHPSSSRPPLKRSRAFVLDENDNNVVKSDIKCPRKAGGDQVLNLGEPPSHSDSSGKVEVVAETQLDEPESEESFYQLNQL